MAFRTCLESKRCALMVGCVVGAAAVLCAQMAIGVIGSGGAGLQVPNVYTMLGEEDMQMLLRRMDVASDGEDALIVAALTARFRDNSERARQVLMALAQSVTVGDGARAIALRALLEEHGRGEVEELEIAREWLRSRERFEPFGEVPAAAAAIEAVGEMGGGEEDIALLEGLAASDAQTVIRDAAAGAMALIRGRGKGVEVRAGDLAADERLYARCEWSRSAVESADCCDREGAGGAGRGVGSGRTRAAGLEVVVTVRLGVIGAGEHSRTTHGPALRSVNRRWPGRVELAAACDLDGARAAAYAAEFGFARSYQDVEAMLSAERLDGLIAVTPVKATERVVSGLLPRRVPLVIEKPPGETAAAAQRLLERAQRHGCPHMVSFNRRFNPALVRARQWMEEAGEARRPRTVLGRMLRHARREAGFAVETGIHLIDAVLSLMGAPASVEVLRAGAGAAECCSYVAQMRFADQRAAVVVISPSVGVLEETLEIHGEDYCLKVDVGGQSAELWEDRRPRWRWATPESDERGIQDVIGETEAFVRAIEGKGPYWPDLTDAVAAMRVAEAVQGEGGEL